MEADILRKVQSANERSRSYFVGGTATAGSFLLIGMNAVYQKAHPNRALHLKIERPEVLHRMLAAGELALALTDAPYDRAFFLSEPYCMDRLTPVFAPGYLKRRTFSLGDYIRGGGTFILDESGSGGRAELERFVREHGLPEIDPARITEVCSLDAVKILVQAGGGMSVLSELAAWRTRSRRVCFGPGRSARGRSCGAWTSSTLRTATSGSSTSSSASAGNISGVR